MEFSPRWIPFVVVALMVLTSSKHLKRGSWEYGLEHPPLGVLFGFSLFSCGHSVFTGFLGESKERYFGIQANKWGGTLFMLIGLMYLGETIRLAMGW